MSEIWMPDEEWLARSQQKVEFVRPPHFPDPNPDKIAILESALVERDEMLAEAHKEAKAWQAQLEVALKRIDDLEKSKGCIW